MESIAISEDQTKDSSVEPKSTTGSESTQRTPAPTSVPAVNIFGAAKPVDTTAREREIEERLAKSYAESRSREEMYVIIITSIDKILKLEPNNRHFFLMQQLHFLHSSAITFTFEIWDLKLFFYIYFSILLV